MVLFWNWLVPLLVQSVGAYKSQGGLKGDPSAAGAAVGMATQGIGTTAASKGKLPAGGLTPQQKAAALAKGDNYLLDAVGLSAAPINPPAPKAGSKFDWSQLIGPGIGAASTLLGARSQSGAANKASELSAKATAEALAFEREKEARRRQEYDQMIAAEKAQWEAEQARLSPYRNASLGILAGAADRIGYSMPSNLQAAPIAPSQAKKIAAPYTGDSLAELAGVSQGPMTAPIPDPELPAMPDMSIGSLGRKRAGDWRARGVR